MTSSENRPNKSEHNSKQTEALEIRSRSILLCPDNDSEARMILKLAEKARVAIVRSEQPHGANLNLEPGIEEKLLKLKKSEVWIVETPGIEKEQELEKQGLTVKIIDHHTYQNLNRLVDLKTGKKKPSSLEQFLAMAKIDDEEMRSWGFEPKTVRGIGIMDAKYVQGLREAGYTKEEINRVFKLKKEIIEEIRPEFNKLLKLAEKEWENRREQSGYLIISSQHGGDMRTAISELSIIHDMDTIPMIISTGNGEKISVQNVPPEVIEKLNQSIKGNTYTFGSGRCWGVNNKNSEVKVTLEEIIQALKS